MEHSCFEDEIKVKAMNRMACTHKPTSSSVRPKALHSINTRTPHHSATLKTEMLRAVMEFLLIIHKHTEVELHMSPVSHSTAGVNPF